MAYKNLCRTFFCRSFNSLYKKNLKKGQTGLSVAFDLPTQTGYDSDHILAKVRLESRSTNKSYWKHGTIIQKHTLEKMNTSMTINAPAWLLALYIATAEKQGG